MLDLLRNAFLLGLGMSTMTREKMNEFARKISEDIRISEEEGQKVVDELIEQIKNSRKNLDELVTKLINETLTKLNVPTRAEYNDLEQRVAKLQSMVENNQTGK